MKMFPAESQFARCLERQNKTWIYQPKRFKLKNTTYRADFYCPENDTYYEVVGTRQAISALRYKIQEFINAYPDIKFKIVKPNGKNYYKYGQRKTDTILKYTPRSNKKGEFNCNRCINLCKQPHYAEVIYCPQYEKL